MSPLGIYIRGMLMGAADIVPGVSGGTMAFITGIYDRLLGAIRAADIECLRLVLGADIKGAWRHIDGNFLLALVLGIGTSVLSLAQLLSWLLETHPVPLWAFFFGLILASALMLLKQVERWNWQRLVPLALGTATALAIALSPTLAWGDGPVAIFFAGFLAICAMILPGISGSFILVLIGMYATVLAAVKNFDIALLLILACGAICGLLVFSRLLHWLLERFRQPTMALLTGFLFGSLAVVWPWKKVVHWIQDSQGLPKPAQQLPVSPGEFQVYSGQDPQLFLCMCLMVAGFVVVWLLESRWGVQPADS